MPHHFAPHVVLLFALVPAVGSGCGNERTAAKSAPPIEPRPWYAMGFEDPVYDSIALHYLGEAWHQSADVGEVLETLRRVDESDPTSWTREWLVTADRLQAVALTAEQSGHRLSAGHAYLRTATYLRAALHHNSQPGTAEVRALAQRSVDAFQKYLALSGSPCRAVRIPYEETTLPGYFCHAPAATAERAPVVVFQEGRDAWAEDGRFLSDELMRRGYHVLLFDGPGMGQVIRLQGLAFRHDWERVVTPVVDYVISRADVDPGRIGYVTVSMGGHLGPRALTREHRIKAAIINPGVMNWHAVYEAQLDQIDPQLLMLLQQNPTAFDARMMALMQQVPLLAWGVPDAMWHHGVDSPSKLMAELSRFVLTNDDVKQITAHMLIVDAEAEEWGQSRQLFDALPGPKDYLLFTASETAQFHVQPGAAGIASQRQIEWLEDVL